MNDNGSIEPRYTGIYRGIVVNNLDKGEYGKETGHISGRCKIFFDGIYHPDHKNDNGALLPWAEPVYPIFAGHTDIEAQKTFDKELSTADKKNWTNQITGWAAVPHVGAYVWGFFERGNINYPKFFGMTNTGDKYLSEHKNQRVFATDNVKITIDEEQLNPDSTSKYPSGVTSSTSSASGFTKEQPTLVRINIDNLKPPNGSGSDKDYCAISININGNTSLNVVGNVYENVEGDRIITHTGNQFIKQVGDIEIEHTGNLVETHTGTRKFTVTGNDTETYGSNRTTKISANESVTVGATTKHSTSASADFSAGGVFAIKGAIIKLN